MGVKYNTNISVNIRNLLVTWFLGILTESYLNASNDMEMMELNTDKKQCS